jgi:hypothetical protein
MTLTETKIRILTTFAPVLQKVCWHVSVGGCTLPTFSLAIGEKAPRKRPLKNRAQPFIFRRNEPEIAIFVWSAWRLDNDENVLAGSEGSDREIRQNLRGIVGKAIIEIEVMPPAWDLTLHFEGHYRLTIFASHCGKRPIFQGNWQARVRNVRMYAGPGEKIDFASANDAPWGAPLNKPRPTALR